MKQPNTMTSRSKAYWLVTTEHLKKGLWFRDDEDYRVGMNYVAIASFVYGVMVLAFVLMSNHVHFVLYCTEAEARAFINEFKADCSRHLALKYGVRDLLRRNRVVIERISPDDESFERALARRQYLPLSLKLPLGDGRCLLQWASSEGNSTGRPVPACNPQAVAYQTVSSRRLDPRRGWIYPSGILCAGRSGRVHFQNPQANGFFPSEFFQGEASAGVSGERSPILPGSGSLCGHSGSLPVDVRMYRHLRPGYETNDGTGPPAPSSFQCRCPADCPGRFLADGRGRPDAGCALNRLPRFYSITAAQPPLRAM